MDMRTFLDILDVLTYAEHFPLCIEASMHSSMYNNTEHQLFLFRD